jgi:NAD(P)-dependent dehydrogenase (short-subunit alcohol dehydrogenase family)
MPDMTEKTVLITGANQGIGKASAIALAQMGARLVLVCRNETKAREAIVDIDKAGAKSVELIVGNLGSQADVRRIAAEFLSRHQYSRCAHEQRWRTRSFAQDHGRRH